MVQTIACSVIKVCYFIMLLVIMGHFFPQPEFYIDNDIARQLAKFISGDINAESVYDAYSYIDWLIMLAIITPVYILTMKLISRVRSK